MEFNNNIRSEMYNFWCNSSNKLAKEIKNYILKEYGNQEIVDKWIEYYSFDVNNDIDKIEVAISILIYNYTFYYINMNKKCDNNINIGGNILLQNIDINLITTITNSREFRDEFNVYISKILDITEKNGLNSFAIIYEDIICDKHRKENGEFYTEDSISKLITTFSVKAKNDSKIKNVLDPMCGTGMFLKNIQEYATEKTGIWGIEKNKFTSYMCNTILSHNRENLNGNINIVNKDLFSIDINNDESIEIVNGDTKNIPSEGFDLIIGNPAYIRYQALGYMFSEIPQYIKDYYINIGKKLENSSDYVTFVGIYIRALLLCKSEHKQQILNNISKIVKKRMITEEDNEWESLVKSYSGLSDSTVPTWFLSYKLCEENGIIGYITSDSWLKKDYGNSLKKFIAKKSKLLYIFDMSNVNCFKDAQVNTSIVICQKSSMIEENINNNVKFIKFKTKQGKKVELETVISNILFKSNINIELESSLYIEFQKFVNNLNTDYEDEYINIRLVKQNNLTIDEEEKLIEWGKYFETGTVLDKIIKEDWEFIEKSSISVNQGMRSGYNNFFYFESVDIDTLVKNKIIDNISDCDFGYKKWEELSDEEKLKIKFNNIINLPYDYKEKRNKYILVLFKYEDIGSKGISAIFINRGNLRKSIKSIKNINTYSIKDESCKTYILDVDKKVISEDYSVFESNYHGNLDYWISKGFGILCESVEKYINFWNKLKIRNKDQYIGVKDMPVLKGYQNKPSKEKLPTMWYTLNFTDRHLPDMFLNRINHKDLNVILNNNSNKYVVDANFNTITFNNTSLDEKMIYFAIFNSTIFKMQLENNCGNLGGGALKVETSGIKKCKVPNIDNISEQTKEKLITLANELASRTLDEKNIIRKIDTLIVNETLKQEKVDSIVNDLIVEYEYKVKERVSK